MTSPAYAFVMVALVVMTYLVLAKGPVGSQPTRRAEREVVITGEGNELRVRRVAPVPYSTLSRLLDDIPSQRPLDAVAFRLVRAAPPEMRHYVLCVTSDGVLVLGEQHQAFDTPAARTSSCAAASTGRIRRWSTRSRGRGSSTSP